MVRVVVKLEEKLENGGQTKRKINMVLHKIWKEKKLDYAQGFIKCLGFFHKCQVFFSPLNLMFMNLNCHSILHTS